MEKIKNVFSGWKIGVTIVTKPPWEKLIINFSKLFRLKSGKLLLRSPSPKCTRLIIRNIDSPMFGKYAQKIQKPIPAKTYNKS